jgi:3'-phosphoadenosine 5'-phosphosulfate sulfotransferase (PAPS reductase)/FAD synthetase
MNTATKSPLVVAYGMGVDSTAMLVGLQQRGEVPDLILFADTGDEKPETYAYLPIINAWLAKVGFPQVTVVKNAAPKTGDRSLSARCLRLGTLPALAYGQHQCSIVWKIEPQRQFVKRWAPAIAAWAAGINVTQLVGYDAGGRDSCRRFKSEGKEAKGYTNRYPLIEWGWDREECERQIAAAGLPVPVKSACFHCPASKDHEITWLKAVHPELAMVAVQMEARAIEYGFKGKGLGRSKNWGELLAAATV